MVWKKTYHHSSRLKRRRLTLPSSGPPPAGHTWPSFHSGPSASCRFRPLMSNVRRHRTHGTSLSGEVMAVRKCCASGKPARVRSSSLLAKSLPTTHRYRCKVPPVVHFTGTALHHAGPRPKSARAARPASWRAASSSSGSGEGPITKDPIARAPVHEAHCPPERGSQCKPTSRPLS